MAFEQKSKNNGIGFQLRTPPDLVPFYEQAGVIMNISGFAPTRVFHYESSTGVRDTYAYLGYRMFVDVPNGALEILESIVEAGVTMVNYLSSTGVRLCNERFIVEQAMRIEAVKQGGHIQGYSRNSA